MRNVEKKLREMEWGLKKRAGEEKKEHYGKRNGGRGRKGGDGSKEVM